MAEWYLKALADAGVYPYWFDDVDEPESGKMLVGDVGVARTGQP